VETFSQFKIKNMKNRNLLLFAFIIAMQFTNAQTQDGKFAIGLGLIRNEYNGDYGSGIFNTHETWYAAGGLSLGYYLTPSFDLGLQGSYGQYGFREWNSFPKFNNFRGLKTDASIFTHYKLNNGYILSKDSKFSPFISVGLGFATYGIDPAYDKSGTNPALFPTIITKGTDLVLPLGAGLKYQLSEHFAIQYQYLYSFTNADNHDENQGSKYFGGPHPNRLKYDAYGQHILSFVINFGKPRDTDKDGVADKFDKCPDTPIGVKVDANGCPIDSDGDGVADYLDKCPDTPAGVKVDAKGCPVDTDGDGVPDYLDKCPDTPKGVTVDANGCPIDADGDGVPDYLDKCPNTPAGVAVDTKGCPVDADGDGVPDYMDKCADTPAGVAVDANGCPTTPVVVSPEINSQFKNTLFQLGKSIVRKPYYANINEVAKFMKENPTYRIELKGYADITGGDRWNIILSQNRANSVKKYLERKGIDSSRITTVGFGKKDPIADNATFKGRMKNRRVEFEIK
jgi:OOP family OmpA-OmpF porin